MMIGHLDNSNLNEVLTIQMLVNKQQNGRILLVLELVSVVSLSQVSSLRCSTSFGLLS